MLPLIIVIAATVLGIATGFPVYRWSVRRNANQTTDSLVNTLPQAISEARAEYAENMAKPDKGGFSPSAFEAQRTQIAEFEKMRTLSRDDLFDYVMEHYAPGRSSALKFAAIYGFFGLALGIGIVRLFVS